MERTRMVPPIEKFAFTLINDSPDLIGFSFIESPFDRVYLNPAGLAMVGLEDVEEWNAHKVADLFDDADVEHFLNNVVPALKEGRSWAEEASIRNIKTGERISVHRRMFPISDPATQQIVAFGTISRDITELKEAQKDVRTAQELLAVREERERIARDLHDSTLQLLVTISYEVEMLRSQIDPGNTPAAVIQHIDALSKAAEEAITEARRTLAAIRSVRFDGSSLEEALRAEIKAKAVLAGYSADLDVTGESRELSPELQDVMLRVVQESLTNSWKHGKAETVHVQLVFGDGNVQLHIEDDGMGFDPDRDNGPRLDGYSLGLPGMKERAQTVGGTLEVKSACGEGCTISLLVPV